MNLEMKFRNIKPEETEWQQVIDLLVKNDITLDAHVESTFALFENQKTVATASVMGNTVRSVAVNAKHKGSNVFSELMHEVMTIIYDNGYNNVFIYTKIGMAQSFKHIGFQEIENVKNQMMLLESRPNGIQRFVQHLKSNKSNQLTNKDIGAIVMNANPFTLGHLHLVEYASALSEFLYIFVVSSEHSIFPYEDRYRLICEGTAHLANVEVVKGGDYIISDATFPSYFLKKPEEATMLQTELDLKIFGKYFAGELGIKKRFVGMEPLCQTTSLYNDKMKQILPKYGVEVVEIPRKEMSLEVISASRVRALLKDEMMRDVEKLIPITTFNYLRSPKGKSIIAQIKKSESRH